MSNIQISKADVSDAVQLYVISRRTFTETFSVHNTPENMNRYLAEMLSMEKLKAELADNNAAFYFAILDDDVIGYLKLNSGQSQTEIKDDNAIEIERIYVLQEFHGKKVGQLLYEKAIEVAKQHNATFVWLGVWEHNAKAISFYRKNGFVVFDKHIFRLGNDEQTDLMMKLEVRDKRT